MLAHLSIPAPIRLHMRKRCLITILCFLPSAQPNCGIISDLICSTQSFYCSFWRVSRLWCYLLSTTNISERIRAATIKVLGFYDKEVYQYVNKETLILTAIGILIGLPAGRILSGFLIAALNMPSIHFTVYITPTSYLISAAITFGFAIIVNWVTNRTLDRINMVEALKSVE